MSATAYYVYSLNDTRTNPPTTFYIGKGTGGRVHDHHHSIDGTQKGKYIQKLREEGRQFTETILASDLTDKQARELEGKIQIAMREAGADLTNRVISRVDNISISRSDLAAPEEALKLARKGLQMLKKAILTFLAANPQGITNAQAARYLKLQSHFKGKQKDYLTWSVIGLLVNDDRITHENKKYYLNPSQFN